MSVARYEVGQRVRVTQQVPRQEGVWTATVEGRVLAQEQQKSGSWYAHSRDGKVWVDRVQLEKDDGELVWLNLDQYSHVDVLDEAGAA